MKITFSKLTFTASNGLAVAFTTVASGSQINLGGYHA